MPSFGPVDARLLIVGLAPGMHGANATGRPFTGDYAGILLYATLHEYGFASAPESERADDGLALHDCRITNAVKCLPPQNRPTTAEIRECNGYLAAEIAGVRPRVILALGKVAHDAVLRTRGLALARHPFAHAAEHRLDDDTVLVDSYHCSRYNTQTGRLTPAMFRTLFARIREQVS
ncbi:uracil-DNA glycosylase [Thioalkalivibrio sp. AKL17]|uniref:uracil-DNA glycosylase n=1 Tax=Thioalkalivibrio sp. AKL17 TaxID=1158160 RepID=UPI0003602B00